MVKKRYGKEVQGKCSICGFEGYTEMHHIISRAKIEKINRPDLMKNEGNLVELCKPCHDLTDSSEYRMWRIRQNPKTKRTREEVRLHREKKRKKKGLHQCMGRLKKGRGRRCEASVKWKGGYCRTHASQDPGSNQP